MQKYAETAAPDIDFGVNADGWEFRISNETDKYLWVAVILPTDNIERIEDPINPGTIGKVKGKPSALFKGYPADCRFSYYHNGSGVGAGFDAGITSSFGSVARFSNAWVNSKVVPYFPDQDINVPQLMRIVPKAFQDEQA